MQQEERERGARSLSAAHQAFLILLFINIIKMNSRELKIEQIKRQGQGREQKWWRRQLQCISITSKNHFAHFSELDRSRSCVCISLAYIAYCLGTGRLISHVQGIAYTFRISFFQFHFNSFLFSLSFARSNIRTHAVVSQSVIHLWNI
jgi:hypothetical protein